MLDPNSVEFQIGLWLTILVIILKFSLAAFYLRYISIQQKKEDHPPMGFYWAVFLFLVLMGVARIFYFDFDFILTKYDTTYYLLPENLSIWRIGSFFSGMAMGVFLILLDWKVLQFKLKGILGAVLVASAVLHLVFPIENMDDFTILSNIGMFMGFAALVVPGIFIWLGIKTPGIRKLCFLIATGIIVYALGGMLISEGVIGPLRDLYGQDAVIFIIVLHTALKVGGLLLLVYGSLKIQLQAI